MRIYSYLQSVQDILSLYKGDVPFASWLKAYFSAHKKFGSKDRKHIAHLCYCYFRLGGAFKNRPVEERIRLALFLCSESGNNLLAGINEEWNNMASLPAVEKLAMLSAQKEAENIFPFPQMLSKELDAFAFHLSFLTQPLVYLRLRPGKEQKVKETFFRAEVPFTQISDTCLAISSSTKADGLITLDADAVVQDRNSQRVLEVLDTTTLKGKINIWDCCAASGGKSMLALDTFGKVQLTVTDIRQSILHNLRNRLGRAGFQNFRSLVADVSTASPFSEKFDLVICDAPCSGSGTWGRTPEQLSFFPESKIDTYAQLQKSIAVNAAQNVKRGGQFLYITCSVFQQENEDVVNYIQQNTSLQLHQAQYLKGYDKNADTLFAASFKAL